MSTEVTRTEDRELVAAHRRAVERSVEIVAAMSPDQLDLPTPCAGWRLRELLEHSIAQHHGFARAADGEVTVHADWAPRPLGDDPVAEYTTAARRVITAFGAKGVLQRQMFLAEFPPPSLYPGTEAIGFHLVDYIAHGWDLAKTIGVDPDYPDEVVQIAMSHILAVPAEGPVRESPSAPFAPVVDVPEDIPLLDRAVAYLGRSPRWPD